MKKEELLQEVERLEKKIKKMEKKHAKELADANRKAKTWQDAFRAAKKK